MQVSIRLSYSAPIISARGLRCSTCGTAEPNYLIWRSGNKVYYQKFMMDWLVNICRQSPVVQYDSSQVFLIFDKHINKIESEYLMPFIARHQYEGRELYQVISTFHPSHYHIEFYWKRPGYVAEKGYEHYPVFAKSVQTLNVEKERGGSVNLNYEFNSQSGTMLLINRILHEIDIRAIDYQLSLPRK